MIFAYLDEFGHDGPFFSRDHASHNTSPVFGLAGLLLPEEAVRPFASYFLNRKVEIFSDDIAKSGKQAFEWEKKGANLFTANSIQKYPQIRQAGFRLLNQVRSCGGYVFYYGRDKIRGTTDLNSTGFYKTILSHTLRQIDSYAEGVGQNFHRSGR